MRRSPVRLFARLAGFSLLLAVAFSQSPSLTGIVRGVLQPALSAGRFLGRSIDALSMWCSGALRRERQSRDAARRLADLEAVLVERERELLRLRRQMRGIQESSDASGVAPRGLLPALVEGMDPSPWARSLWVDRGAEKGVACGMPALAGEVLIGHVAEVEEHRSRIQLLADPMSAAMVEVSPPAAPSPVEEREPAQGVVKGTGNDTRYRLDFIPNTIEVSAGQAVVTTGFDAKYPRGLLVGRVESVQKGDLFQRIKVSVPVRLSALDAVVILTRAGNASPGGGR